MNRILPLAILAFSSLAVALGAQVQTPVRTQDIERGTLARKLEVKGKTREYLLHVPKTYDGKKSVPLVFILHGRGSNGSQAARYYGMTAKADRHGFLAVYPTALGEPRSWEPGYFRGDSDVPFLKALIDHIEKNYKVDLKRIYVGGHSSGGIMSYAAAAHLSDRIAAIGVVAGSIGIQMGGVKRGVPAPKHPVSVIHFHGIADNVVPYDKKNGAKARYNFFVPAPDSAAFFAKHCGCDNEATQKKTDDLVIDTWKNGKAGTTVALYSIVDGGHGWPGASRRSRGTLKATDVMWKFFADHPKQPMVPASIKGKKLDASFKAEKRDKKQQPQPSG